MLNHSLSKHKINHPIYWAQELLVVESLISRALIRLHNKYKISNNKSNKNINNQLLIKYILFHSNIQALICSMIHNSNNYKAMLKYVCITRNRIVLREISLKYLIKKLKIKKSIIFWHISKLSSKISWICPYLMKILFAKVIKLNLPIISRIEKVKENKLILNLAELRLLTKLYKANNKALTMLKNIFIRNRIKSHWAIYSRKDENYYFQWLYLFFLLYRWLNIFLEPKYQSL